MRRGSRQGQAVADALRIYIRQEPAPKGPDSPDTPASSGVSSAATTPSSTASNFPPGATKVESPSPTSTSFAPGITSVSVPPATTTLPASTLKPLVPSSGPTTTLRLPIPPLSTKSIPVLAPPSTTVLPVPVVTSVPSSVVSSTVRRVSPDTLITSTIAQAPTSTTPAASDGFGQPQVGQTESESNQRGTTGTGIAIGSIAGVILFASAVFYLWRWRRRRNRNNKDHLARLPSRDSWHPPAGSNKSDSRIMDELMSAAFRTNGGVGNDYEGQGYADEKQRALAVDPALITPVTRPTPVARPGPGSKISKWLDLQTPEMVNPNTARASMASSAAGLSFPPSSPGLTETPDFVIGVEMPYPLPKPPPTAPSVAQTENTSVSTGTWNTWGVMQHRDQPKTWKDKIGL